MTQFVSQSADLPAGSAFEWIADGFAFGGDYSPEQWPEEVWEEDVALMRRAGVNSVNLGVFSWGLLEVADGEFEWAWLDRIMGMLHENGIGVNLATPTAAPPLWLLTAHPEIATVDEYGHRTSSGGRLAWSPSSATFRRYALRMVRAIAERYRDHPALRMWHVSNEIGNENGRCYSDETSVAWQAWLKAKYLTPAAMNEAWGAAFWGHVATSFDQVLPPRFSRTAHNPGLLLDFERFTSDALLGHYLAERDVLREVTPRIPITTNFMVMGMNDVGVDDYRRWSDEVDLVANDHYTLGAEPLRHSDLAFSADRVRGMSHGRPWLLIEHSTAAVNWQQINRAKSAGELTRNTLSHIARGSDGAMYFQWRQSASGSEQWHSGIVTHTGADSKVFRDVEALGAALRRMRPIVGTTVAPARIAILFDHEAAAALRSSRTPSDLIRPLDLPIALHHALTTRGFAVDVVTPRDGFAHYDLVLVPTLYLANDATSSALTSFVEAGGHALVTYFAGVVDESNRIRTGGYPGAFRELLGIRTEEYFPLLAAERVHLDNGWAASLWSELLELRGADALASYTDGELAGVPAYTRRTVGAGSASYLATRPDEQGLLALVDELTHLAGIVPIARVDAGLEIVRRVGDAGSFLFAINHTDAPLTVTASGRDLISGNDFVGETRIDAGRVVVLEEAR